jgi:hypothetical protein
VNPNSGPGAPPLPDANYVREIARLNSYANVDTLGYIAIRYCKKPLREVLEEIQTYATWAHDYVRTGLGVQGIFFDETPNLYSSEAAEYLTVLQSYIKGTPGILGKQLVRMPCPHPCRSLKVKKKNNNFTKILPKKEKKNFNIKNIETMSHFLRGRGLS